MRASSLMVHYPVLWVPFNNYILLLQNFKMFGNFGKTLMIALIAIATVKATSRQVDNNYANQIVHHSKGWNQFKDDAPQNIAEDDPVTVENFADEDTAPDFDEEVPQSFAEETPQNFAEEEAPGSFAEEASQAFAEEAVPQNFAEDDMAETPVDQAAFGNIFKDARNGNIFNGATAEDILKRTPFRDDVNRAPAKNSLNLYSTENAVKYASQEDAINRFPATRTVDSEAADEAAGHFPSDSDFNRAALGEMTGDLSNAELETLSRLSNKFARYYLKLN